MRATSLTKAHVLHDTNKFRGAPSRALADAGEAYAHTGAQLASHYQRTTQQKLATVLSEGSHKQKPRRISSVQEAMDAARYNSAQARVQREVYNAVLDITTPQPGESLLDWGANTGALGFSAIERGEDSFVYIPVDGSPEAIAQIKNNLNEQFTGEVLPLVHTNPLDLKPGSVDHVIALGSITHWALDIPDVQAKVEALIENFAKASRKTAVISLYPMRRFNTTALSWGILAGLSTYTEVMNGTSVDPSSSALLGLSLTAMLFANPSSRRTLLNNLPTPIATAGRALATRFSTEFDPVGNWIHEIDTPALLASLRRKGYNVELISVDKGPEAKKGAIPHGPWDLIVIRQSQARP